MLDELKASAAADSTSSPVATQVIASADMIEDYNNAMLPPCRPIGLTFCAVTNTQQQTELLTVSDQNQLLWIYPDSSAATGWSQATTDFIGISTAPAWLNGFYTANAGGGTPLLTVFYGTGNFSTDPQSAYGMQYDGTAWSSLAITPQASSLLGQLQVQPIQAVPVDVGSDAPRVLVCGVGMSSEPSPGTIVYFLGPEAGTNTWTTYFTQEIPNTFNTTMQAGMFPGTATGLAFMVSCSSTQTWYAASVDWDSATITTDQIGRGSSWVTRQTLWTTAVPCDPAWYSFITVDDTNGIANWLMSGGSSDFTPLSNGAGQPNAGYSFGAGLLPNGLLVAFALEDSTNLLWMLQQTGTTGGGTFTWTQLGDYGTAIAVPPTMSVPQVVIFDDEGNVDLLSQNTDGSWFKNTMATPTQPTQTYPACSGGPLTFTAVLNPTTNATELLSINAQGQLLWLVPDPSNPSGWDQTAVPFAGGSQVTPAWLCGFYTATPEADGPAPVLTVFYGALGEAQQAFGMQCIGGIWSGITCQVPSQFSYNPLALPQIQPLQFVQTDAWGPGSPVTLVYGVASLSGIPGVLSNSLAFFLAPQAGTGIWMVYYEGEITIDGESLLSPYLLAGIFPGSATGLVFADYNSHGPQDWLTGVVTWSSGTTQGAIAANSLGAWSPTDIVSPRQTITVPSDGAGNCYSLIVLDEWDHLTNWYWDGSGGSTSLSGGGGQPQAVIDVAAGVLPNGLLGIFALDGSGTVWYLPQTDATGTGHFGSWCSLPDLGAAVAIAAPPVMAEPLVFMADNTGPISASSFTSMPGQWTTQTVALPYQGPPPLASATTYTIELTAADVNGNPVAGAVLNIEPDTPQTLVINNIAYSAMPGATLSAVADSFGRVTVSALAAALASPQFTVTIPNGTFNGTFRADTLMHNRLAGNDPNFPVDAVSYQNAGLLPSTVDSGTATTFCQNMQQLAQGAVNLAAGGGATSAADRQAPRGFVFDFSTRGTLVCRDLTAEEVSHLAAAASAGESIFSELWGDVAHYLKQVWQQVKSVAVTIGDDITVAITDIDDDLHSYVMKAIDDIRDAIEVVLQALNNIWNDITNFIDKAIDWLKALFDWDDIVNTKNVLKYIFQQNIANAQQLVANPALQTAINSEFTTLKSDVDAIFAQIEGIFGQTSFTQAGPQTSSSPMLGSTSPMLATPLNSQWSTTSMQINYATSKAGTSLPAAPASVPGNGLTAQVSMSSIDTAFKTAFASKEEKIKQAAAGLYQQIEAINSLSAFLDTAICSVLTAANDLAVIIVAGVEGVIDAILNLAGAALAAMVSFLEQPIDVPVISTLYQKISGSQLTILDLMCLIAAIPCTLLYKIFYGGQDATPPFTTAQAQAFCSSPIIWPWIDQVGGSGAAVRKADAGATDAQGSAAEILAIFACVFGIFNGTTDALGDYLNVQAYADDDFEQDPGQVKLVGWINVTSSFLQMGVSMPWTALPETDADISNLVNSLVPGLTWLADVVNMVASGEQAKFFAAQGPSIVGTIGVLQLISGCVTAANMENDSKYTGIDQAGAVMSSFSPLAKWLTYLAADTTPIRAGICAAVMAILDVTGDLVVPLMSL